MPARVSHLPHHRERVALQMLHIRGELNSAEHYPTGATTLTKMMDKGWVVRTQSGYRITEAGSVALKAKVPADYDKKR